MRAILDRNQKTANRIRRLDIRLSGQRRPALVQPEINLVLPGLAGSPQQALRFRACAFARSQVEGVDGSPTEKTASAPAIHPLLVADSAALAATCRAGGLLGATARGSQRDGRSGERSA